MPHDVSVIIATYNGAAFIESSLESVFAQSERPAEIVVVDDRSTDETPAIVQSIARESRVPIHFIPLTANSGGPSKPLNIGIAEAKSECIALLDQDDLMRVRRIEAQCKALLACPQCSIVIGRFSIIGCEEDDVTPMWPVPQFHELESYIDEKSDYSVIDSETAFKPLLNRNYASSMSGFCFTKQWFRKIGKLDETVVTCPDLDFMLRATLAGPIAVVNEKLFDYRWSVNSLQRQNVTRSLLEATMVRLRAASMRPEWAGDALDGLRHSALILANAAVRKGDFRAVRELAETLSRHKGLLAVKQTLNNKTRRLIGLPGR